jgi:hypothetical protein
MIAAEVEQTEGHANRYTHIDTAVILTCSVHQGLCDCYSFDNIHSVEGDCSKTFNESIIYVVQDVSGCCIYTMHVYPYYVWYMV